MTGDLDRDFPEDLLEIKKELKKKSSSQGSWPKANLTFAEKQLVQKIQTRTNELNRNNVTRTQAYYAFYRKHPDIKWALLGHMVSRNGGWNMTDLQGEFLSKLLSLAEQQQFFTFLERGNWLIFQDAYPQFLLYEESLRTKTPLFHLLRFLHVSTFMETLWNRYWMTGDQRIITIALIINEQSYLEKRVIRNKYYQQTVLDTIHFKLQDLLGLSHILFPYEMTTSGHTKLLGQTLRHFASLEERINLGKRLFSLLLDHEQKLCAWAGSTPHTGSRKDFWPHLFNNIRESLPGSLYIPQIKDCTLTKNGRRLYSPVLENAWKNVEHNEAETGDWFEDWRIIDYFQNSYTSVNGEIRDEYCKSIEKLELAFFAKKALHHSNR
ncbi:hypothetical protein SD71_01285 [Cohnella kolymensis]|uniref:DUF2515 domain-containing protein n=1 Tax=Cohnella kolymensis TaxID=1590652 RepID=A0ABR5A9I6_9BACL|nr:hypothetical protein SD71_01285 [Cohnella kolymensis]